MGQPAWASRFATSQARQDGEEELERLLATWTIKYPAEELSAILQGNGCPPARWNIPETCLMIPN